MAKVLFYKRLLWKVKKYFKKVLKNYVNLLFSINTHEFWEQ